MRLIEDEGGVQPNIPVKADSLMYVRDDNDFYEAGMDV